MIDMQKAREICKKINGRELFDAGCCTVAEMATIPGRPEKEFCEVAHPEFCDWCEIIVFAVNSLPAAFDEIDRLNERVSDLEESLTIAYMLGGNAKEKEIDRLREALVDERANQIGWLTFDRGEMSWEEATREDARKQLEAEGKL